MASDKTEREIARLVKLYRETQRKIIIELVEKTASGRINSARVMAAINRMLEELDADTEKWLRKNLPQQYFDGQNDAARDLRRFEVEVKEVSVLPAINKAAIETLVLESSDALGESIRGVSRSARSIVNNAKRQQLNFIIAQGRLQGEALRTIAAGVERELATNGLPALIDRAGRKWQADTYAEMLVRTKITQSRNQGLANGMLAAGYDLVQVTTSRSKHEACREQEGDVLSLTGRTTGELPGGFEVAGTVEEAKEKGLFHPNCKHRINVIKPTLAARTKAYEVPDFRRG